MSKEMRELSRMGRRRFTKAISAIGLSGTTLDYLSQTSLMDTVDDLSDEVPYVALLAYNNPDANFEDSDATGRAPVYRTMPRDRWQINRAAFDASQRALEQVTDHLGKRDDIGVEVRTDGKSVANRIVLVSTRLVRYTDNTTDLTRLHEAAPKYATGVVGKEEHRYTQKFPVDVESVTIDPQAYYDSNYDGSIPGGCEISAPQNLSDPPATSTCGAELESNGHPLLISAGHVIERAQPSEFDEILQPQGGEVVGDHGWHKLTSYFDAGYSFHNDGITEGTKLANNSGGRKSETIDGIVPYTTIINSIGNEDYTMHIQGRTTGVHDVYPTDIRSGTSDNSYQFKTSIGDTLDGDSGGPHFKIDGGYVYIMGVHAGVHSDDNEPVATSAEYVEKEFDLKIPVLGRDKL